jgi:hypothetical protein
MTECLWQTALVVHFSNAILITSLASPSRRWNDAEKKTDNQLALQTERHGMITPWRVKHKSQLF